MRWDVWWKGALLSGALAVVAIAPAILENGVTGTEAWALLSVFIGGIGLWCKTHKLEWDGVERRADPPTQQK